MKRLVILLLAIGMLASSCSKYKYDAVANDPTKTRIYTLDNGLKVYMSVNKQTPSIQTYIAVKVGSKNDPAQTTGLAHYFEHLMFKGTKSFGTSDYAAEEPLLAQIEELFEQYRQLTDPAERAEKYRVIDSLSYIASGYAIPNEYDKMMAAIGSTGTNAWTGVDETVYTEDIPSNQIENWAKIQSDRFKNSVIRGFHTELETVYEEKNMSLTQDLRRAYEAMLSGLFLNHPYGTQTTLGTQEHLKNPSITNIKNYYNQWYVPNNIAICISGDFDPNEMIETIDKYFGDMTPNENLPTLSFEPEMPITAPIEKEVFGLEAESTLLGFRLPAANSSEALKMRIVAELLSNGKAGIIDLNVIQKQTLLEAEAGVDANSDYSILYLYGKPKTGQTLIETKEILLSQIETLKKGEFSESLLKGVINNYKAEMMKHIESNSRRAHMYVESFICDVPWSNYVNMVDDLGKITKDQIVKFAKVNFASNYAVVYKRQGKDLSQMKIDKPSITPIMTNRDNSSDFLKEIQSSEVKPIEPVFVDFDKDFAKGKGKSGVEIYSVPNNINGLFRLTYTWDTGTNENPILSYAVGYIDYLGTSKMSAEEFKSKLFELACSFNIRTNEETTNITIEGLAENQATAVALVEEFLSDMQPNEEALKNLKVDIAKIREDNKHDQRYCFTLLRQYVAYGGRSPMKAIAGVKYDELTSEQLIGAVKDLSTLVHKVVYYGTYPQKDIKAQIDMLHNTAEGLKPVSTKDNYPYAPTTENMVYIAPYDAAQIYYAQYNNQGYTFDLARDAVSQLYNSYFGKGMNAVVFQEMREARGLAYSAWASIYTPQKLTIPYFMIAFIATQSDKANDAMSAFDQIINDMPLSENSFKITKESELSGLRTERIIKDDIIWYYLACQKLGVDYDKRKTLFETIETLTLDYVAAFQRENIKDKKWHHAILGRKSDLDMKTLSGYGTIKQLSLEDIFGY